MNDDDSDLLESDPILNDSTWDLVHQILGSLDELRVEPVDYDGLGLILDFGVDAPGSLAAGLALAEVCTAGLADISIVPGEMGGIGWPQLFVQSDDPVEACLFSQYAGWQIAVGEYFAMGSGPMRAAANKEELFEKLGYNEEAFGVVGVLESGQLPTAEAVEEIASSCNVDPDQVALLVAPTASIAGNMQVIARSVETSLHKLFELGFDVGRVESACGSAPISPVAKDDLTGIGLTNDAILYGGRVTLWVNGDDDSIREIGPQVPSSASPVYGKPFLEIFEAADRDFYKIDPNLFSPAEILIHNVQTGSTFHFGGIDHSVLKKSFGLG
ncbi:methenyltetrahydromethanopterin cyclohydrolase [Thalassoglobus sp.]|uniref:methenyltetrahydromethanopterin cyclohydrolase n=1 Tax=Thalassoglobus sp. TaxID=2795869 RepID=UPI003AA8118D